MENDIRWIQRLSSYGKALVELREAVNLSKTRTLSKLEKQGLIQCFEYTHELAWKTQKDFLENSGTSDLFGSKDVARQSFKTGLISNGEIWMDMVKSRNQTSHIYDEKITEKIIDLITNSYLPEFESISTKLTQLKQNTSI